MPDNLTVSPNGAVLLCEDNEGSDQYLRGVTLSGGVFDFALNLNNSYEWTGATFAVTPPVERPPPAARPIRRATTTPSPCSSIARARQPAPIRPVAAMKA